MEKSKLAERERNRPPHYCTHMVQAGNVPATVASRGSVNPSSEATVGADPAVETCDRGSLEHNSTTVFEIQHQETLPAHQNTPGNLQSISVEALHEFPDEDARVAPMRWLQPMEPTIWGESTGPCIE